MHNKTRTSLAAGLALAVVMAGCAGHAGRDTYPRHRAGQAYTVQEATVVEIREVWLEGRSTRVGTLGGAWIGAAAAGSLGDGHGSRVATALGGVAGAVAGRSVERELTGEGGLEILLRLRSGKQVVVVQDDEIAFAAGEQVRVYRDRDSARVVKSGR